MRRTFGPHEFRRGVLAGEDVIMAPASVRTPLRWAHADCQLWLAFEP